ncbi:TPA: aspartate 4-decarboxylase [Candidatus Dependentiae bacterium]|nr:MAG: Aminotransferase class I and II [candidate division TM6 bacterium GW2011_GWE2_31_21]KKP53862.1 MAG: Aminotransferase class I and II [candidate division TM6 bacterium GW2011_GWF2_33_332]HBS47642.1 aspartate 4-decarboxylase [Candidatus Dependentiae bacterium]HBZ73791.1 aspartate 4-decarboxylase [Candidatus Dependentiae bacterium]
MPKKNFKKYETMSPFELKNVLREMAYDGKKAYEQKNKCEIQILNAGRGNPNFLNTTARDAFCYLSLFATKLADSKLDSPDLGLRPEKDGIAKKFEKYLEKSHKNEAFNFLKKALNYATKEMKLDADSFIYEIADASLGDFYPSPPRIFPNTEKIVNKYLATILSDGHKPASGKFDLFATEGATAAMIYIFNSLKINKIIHEGDHIAIITPIFSPYLEIPMLKDFNLVEVFIKCDEEDGWQISDTEINKLKDKKIKALYLVNPTNPTSVSLSEKTLNKIAKVVQNQRKDLIILTDTVYSTFVDGFHSLVEIIPQNTICVYSYSKFFGVTGWRLGVLMLHENNIIDKKISKLPKKDILELNKRYSIAALTPEKIKFIDRVEMDSRDVALAHTGGLSGPQQCIMCLFSLFYLLDKERRYKKAIQAKLKKRVQSLYDNLELKFSQDPSNAYYYALINIEKYAEQKYGIKFATYLKNNFEMVDFLFRLAKEKFTICLPGEGFAGPKWSLRVSLANLNDADYITIGKNIKDVLSKYHKEWKK